MMKQKILMIFSLCILVMSIAMVTIQAGGVPEFIADELCYEHCNKTYPNRQTDTIEALRFTGCMDGCMFSYGYPET